MNKISFLFLLIFSIGVKAQSVKDYVYTSNIEYDSNNNLLYFDVYLDGDNFYTGYGMDIKLSQGMTINGIKGRQGTKPNIVLLQNSGMYKDEFGDTEHSISSSYPQQDDNTHARVGCISSGNYDMGRTSGALFRVYVDIPNTSTWPLGIIKLYDIELGKVGSHHNPTDTERIVCFNNGEIELPLTISYLKWSTCILPFSTTIPEGVTAYTCDSHDDEYLYLTKSETMEAYTPYILYSEDGFSGTLSGTVEADKYPENGYVNAGYLNGAIVPQSVTEGYVMQNLSEGVKFYPIAENATFSVPAGKCWVTMPEGNAKSLGFAIADETAVKDMNASKKSSSEAIYNLQGIKVDKMTPGNIYIKGGRTVLKIK